MPTEVAAPLHADAARYYREGINLKNKGVYSPPVDICRDAKLTNTHGAETPTN